MHSKIVGNAAAVAIVPAILVAAQPAGRRPDAGPPSATEVQITGHILQPADVEASGERIAGLELPGGFIINSFAEGLGKIRMLAVGEDGALYVTRREEGDCLMLRDTDGDGKADETKTVARKPHLHGLTIHGGRVYLASIKEVYVAPVQPDGTLGDLEPIIDDLPDAGQHPNRTLAFGPDGQLYITVGSTCNACDEPNGEHATILRTRPNGSGRRVFASGLRNVLGFGWHPETREMYAFDHGIDWLGDDEQKEELNHVREGESYGWPYIYADGKHNLADRPPDGKTYEQLAAECVEPVLLYDAHAAPMQMVFYTGEQFPQEYRNDAFVAMHGSWNRKPPSGYEVVRVRFNRDGEPESIEPFLTGFLTETRHGEWVRFGRPCGIAVAKDGSLLVGDDLNGVIYRISYGG